MNGVEVIQTYTVNASTGALTAIAAAPAPSRAGGLGGMAVNQAGTFLFGGAANDSGYVAVSVFSIASDGSLSELQASPFASTSVATASAIAVSPDGNYVYVMAYNSSGTVIDVFSVASDGTATFTNAYNLNLLPYTMFLHPTGSWLYVYAVPPGGEEYYSLVEQLNTGPGGTLTDMGAYDLPAESANMQGFTGNSAGTFLFAVYGDGFNGGTDITSLDVDPTTGQVSLATTLKNPSLPAPVLDYRTNNAAIDPTGSFLYTIIASFSVSNGALTLLQTFPPQTGASGYGPTLILASPNTPFLFGAGPDPGTTETGFYISSDQIGSNGFLTPAPGSPYTATIYGLAVTGSVPIPNAPAVTFTPSAPVNFGNVVIGQNGQASVRVVNSGFAALNITNVSVSGDPSLTETNNCTSSLAPDASCTVNLTFAATVLGTVNGTLTVTSNAPTATLSLTGNGINPFPIAQISPGTLNFPNTALNSTSSAQVVTVGNASNATASLNVQSITISGSNPNDFSQTNNCTAPVAAGSSCSIIVTFAPLALGSRTAQLIIGVNVPNVNAYGVTLAGNGAPSQSQYQLSTSAVGPGTIQQSPSGTSFAPDTSITLTAVPNANSSFTSWSGACNGSASTTCNFSITGNTTVTATFTSNPSVTVPQGSQSGAPGSTFTFAINTSGFSTKPTLTASCSIPSGTCSISGTTLTVTTTASDMGFLPVFDPHITRKVVPLLSLTLALMLAIWLLSTDTRARRLARLTAVAGGLTMLAACGGGGGGGTNPAATPAGTYIVTIKAVAGSQAATATVSVTVQ